MTKEIKRTEEEIDNKDERLKEPIISVIIPCYQRHDVIDVCLPALERQACKDFEIILVDDCSTNDLYDELRDYAKKSRQRIKVFRNEENRGPGRTRNFGIQQAQGRYLMFVDSDDYISEDAINILSEIICLSDADCIYFDFTKVMKKKRKRYYSIQSVEGKINQSEALMFGNGSTWSKIFKRNIIKENNIAFADIPLGEDYVYTKSALLFCKSIYYVRQPLYCYIDKEESLMKKNISGKYASVQWNLIEAKWPEEKWKLEREGIYIYLMILFDTWYRIKSGTKWKEVQKRVRDINREYPNWHDNEYIFKFPKYQKKFLNAVWNENLILLKFIVVLRDLLKHIIGRLGI